MSTKTGIANSAIYLLSPMALKLYALAEVFGVDTPLLSTASFPELRNLSDDERWELIDEISDYQAISGGVPE